MTYLYAAMGIAVMSGVIAVLEYTTAISKSTLYNRLPNDLYDSSIEQKVDQILINILHFNNEDLGNGDSVCINLKSKFKLSGFSENLISPYGIGLKTPSTHNDLKNSCILTNGNHRIIIAKGKTKEQNHVLFSCITTNNEYCDYELEN